MGSLPVAQPQPWGPHEVLFTAGVQAFAQTVGDSLTGVGDKADTFDTDLSTTATVLGSFPKGSAALDDDLTSAVSAHEDLRRYEPGVPALLKQALHETSGTQSLFEQWLTSVQTPPASQPPISGGSIASSQPSGTGSTGVPPGPGQPGGGGSVATNPRQR